MPSGAKGFLGGLLGGVTQGLMARVQRKLDETREKKQQELSIASAALANPDVTNKDEISQHVNWLIGGGKPLKPQEMPVATHVANIIAQAKAHGEQEYGGAGPNSGPVDVDANGTPKPQIDQNPQTSGQPFRIDQMPTFKYLTPEQKAATAAKTFADRQAVIDAGRVNDINARGEQARATNAAKPTSIHEGTKTSTWEDIPEDQRPDDGKPGQHYVPQFSGATLLGWRPVSEPKDKTSVGFNDRVKEVQTLHPDWDTERVNTEVVRQRVQERAQVQQERQARFSTWSKLSDQALEKNTEALAYAKQNQPLLLEAKRLGLLTSSAKLKTAQELAKLLSDHTESSVNGQDPADVAKQLVDQGYTGGTGVKPPAAKVDPNTQALADLVAKYAASTSDSEKADLATKIAAARAKVK